MTELEDSRAFIRFYRRFQPGFRRRFVAGLLLCTSLIFQSGDVQHADAVDHRPLLIKRKVLNAAKRTIEAIEILVDSESVRE